MKEMKTFLETLEFYTNPKMEKDTVYLGKHQLRFKTKLVNDFELKAGDRLRIGFKRDESTVRHLYLIKSTDNSGFLFVESKNHTYSVAFKGLYTKLGILEPTNAKYEIGEESGIKYIKIALPKF